MKRISDVRKIKEGYGRGTGAFYTPYSKVGEFGSSGTCSNPIDWRTGRTVHLFSQGEAIAWHIMRWNDNVSDIREQYPLDSDITQALAHEYGIRPSNNGRTPMTSDFLVDLTNHGQVVVSVKASRDCMCDNRTVEKLFLEQEYWRRKGILFTVTFKPDLNRTCAENIRRVVAFYDPRNIVDDILILKHLIARKEIIVDMERSPLDYLALLTIYEGDVDRWKRLNASVSR